MNRIELSEKIAPYCEPDVCCLQNGEAFGWLYNSEQVEKAVVNWREGTLSNVSFSTKNKKGDNFTIKHPSRIGLVPHRENKVYFFAVDIDAHEGQKDMTCYDENVSCFFGASPIRFHSKGGKGIRQIYLLTNPIEVMAFLECIRSRGFNRQGRIEVFPKTDKLTQFWLPNDPNIETSGDSFISGNWEKAVIQLPETIPVKITNAGLDFLSGFVEQGYRNQALYNCARELGIKQVKKDISERICRHGAELCGLPEQESTTTFESGYNQGITDDKLKRQGQKNEAIKRGISVQVATESIQLINPDTGVPATTEAWFADCIVKFHGDKVRFNLHTGKFLVYNGKQWINDDHGDVFEFCKNSLKTIVSKVRNSHSEYRKKILASLLKFERLHTFSGALGFFNKTRGIIKAESDFDCNSNIFNCQNGTLNLLTFEFKPHNPKDHLCKISEAKYDPLAQCPKWLKFLERIFNGDKDLICYIQRAIGISLLGEPKEQCLFFCYGNGANGKSVFFETLSHLLGSYYQKAPSEMLMAKDQKSHIPNDIARLKGARFVVASELQNEQRFNEAVLKDLTGGDTMSARFLHKEWFDFKPSHKLWIYGNHRPVVRGSDEGIWRRIKLIPFTVQIPLEERIPLPDLVASLCQELSGILNWALEGLKMYKEEGLNDCKAVREATSGYREDSDSLGMFLSETTDTSDKEAEMDHATLYQKYREWCKLTGEHQHSSRRFCSMMRERGFTSRRGAQGCKIWKGLSTKW